MPKIIRNSQSHIGLGLQKLFPLIPLLFIPILLKTCLAAEVTAGPLAQVSIGQQEVYSLARPCAATCLSYRGTWPCQVRGFYDVGVELGCGRCDRINNCYCSSKLGSSATDYISRCVPYQCGEGDWNEEIASMLSIYDAYCKTAMVKTEGTTVAAKTTGAGENSPNPLQTDDAEPGGSLENGEAEETAPLPKNTSAPEKDAGGEKEEEKGGLSRSDVIALAAALGIGIPSLIVAIITLWVQVKKRKAAKRESMALTSPTVQRAYQQPMQQPHVNYGFGYNSAQQHPGSRY